MDNTSARNNILAKIEKALTTSSVFPEAWAHDRDFFVAEKDSLPERFSAEFAALDGKLELFDGKDTLHKRLRELKDENGWGDIYLNKASLPFDTELEDLSFITDSGSDTATAVITGCEYLIARTGTIVLSSAQHYGRALTVYTPVHIVIASGSQLVEDTGDGIKGLLSKYAEGLPSAFFFASGPSRTGDIEKTLVKGVHGPTRVYLFLRVHSTSDQPDYPIKTIMP